MDKVIFDEFKDQLPDSDPEATREWKEALADVVATEGNVRAFFLMRQIIKQAQDLRIGYLNTTSGSGAIIGRHLERGWKLGLEHQGWTKDGDKLGGVPTRVFYADDQSKTDVAVKEVEKFIKQDKVIVGGKPVREESLSDTQIVFTFPARYRNTTIAIRHPGHDNDVVVGDFTVVKDQEVAGFSPLSGPPGTRVEITGIQG